MKLLPLILLSLTQKIFQHDLIISRVYNYFIHNMKVDNIYSFLNHIKMRSSDSLKILKSNKILYDFCFIDGSHKYHDVLSDIKNFSKIRFLYKKTIQDIKECW